MRKIIVLTAALVLLLGIPSIAKAKPPELNKVFATIAYVDEQIKALKDFIGPGSESDFDLPLPENWSSTATPDGRISLTTDENDTCEWYGEPIEAQARAVATYQGDVVEYAVGSCREINFEDLTSLPGINKTVDIEVSLFWMGKEKKVTVPVMVEEPPPLPLLCSLNINPPTGNSPLDVAIKATVYGASPGDLTLISWDFGDGKTGEGGLEKDHTYINDEEEGIVYYLTLTIRADTREYTCPNDVTVYPPVSP